MTRNESKGKGKRKRKERGRGGRRFFKRRKGKGHLAEDQGEAWQSEWWQDGSGMISSGPGRPRMGPMPLKAKERKERKAKAKESGTKKVEKITPKEIPPILP